MKLTLTANYYYFLKLNLLISAKLKNHKCYILISINPRVSFSSLPLLPFIPHNLSTPHVKATCKKTAWRASPVICFTFRNQEKVPLAEKHNSSKNYRIPLLLGRRHSVPWRHLPTKNMLWPYTPNAIYEIFGLITIINSQTKLTSLSWFPVWLYLRKWTSVYPEKSCVLPVL